MFKMVHTLSLTPFSSLSPTASQSQSQSSLASRHSPCLVCCSIPQSKSQSPRITKKPKPPSTTTNYPSKRNLGEILMKPKKLHCKEKGELEKEEGKQHWKTGPISTEEAINQLQFHLAPPNTPTSIYAFNQLLSTLVRAKTSRRYRSIFPHYNHLTQTLGISPDKYTYGYMINICAQMNQLNLSFIFLGRLCKEGHRLDAKIFSPILKCLCSEDRICEAVVMLLHKMPKLGTMPNVFSYNILIKGLLSYGKTDLALQLFFKMVKIGGECEPDVITYTTIIDGLSKERDFTKAFVLYQQMYYMRVIPDIVTYNSLINGFCKNGALDRAMELLHSMKSEGHKPNVVTYSSLIDGMCKNGEIKRAMELLHSMKSEGHKPDVVTYNSLIDALCKNGQIKRAMVLLHSMKSGGHEPDVVTYSILIDTLCKNGEIERAMELLHRMKSEGHEPDVVTYNILIDGLCKNGEIE
ncbi:pentatricopeptide (PPR) repeat protein [Rhynchospora pubera]|uniref:Pentatricopeptide (PPR) repeat protein n=1 Tax=Rhynchospora pubera TaxID=906938 RepID=A0AAV8F3D0_9POAL|nr:pentatricopeptide (PPR) repeat protein [Rhynchospora pubera]